MYGSEFSCFSYWWIIPVILMVLCFFMMRGRRWPMMCGFNETGIDRSKGSDTALEILGKRFAAGEIDKDQYLEMKMTLTDSTDAANE